MQLHELSYTRQWGPFRVDALGLVSLLGTDEVNAALGRLTSNYFSKYLPLLSAFVVANDKYAQPLPGFCMYNISDAVATTDLAGWFSRWVLSQEITHTSTNVSINEINREQKTFKSAVAGILSVLFGISINMFLIIFTCLQADGWAIAHSVSTSATVLVRIYALSLYRRAVFQGYLKIKEQSHENRSYQYDQQVVAYLRLPTRKGVRIDTNRGIMRLLTILPHIQPRWKLVITQTFGWAAFIIQAVTLGSCNLLYQLIIIAVLIVATVIIGCGLFEDQACVAGFLQVDCSDYCEKSSDDDTLRIAYARMNLTAEQEESMEMWGLFPHKRNKEWWERYNDTKRNMHGDNGIALDEQQQIGTRGFQTVDTGSEMDAAGSGEHGASRTMQIGSIGSSSEPDSEPSASKSVTNLFQPRNNQNSPGEVGELEKGPESMSRG